MNKRDILQYLARLDGELSSPTTLYLYGSAVPILLDAPDRTSLDIDVAGPYSNADQSELEKASSRAGLPLNPDPLSPDDHLEWVGPLRLCLPPPQESEPGLKLWQGRRLTVVTGSVPDLVASKLIRYDETDRSDIQFLYTQFRFDWPAVQKSVAHLPHPFGTDALVLENLHNLKADMAAWGGNRP
jgi:hypothetical protein